MTIWGSMDEKQGPAAYCSGLPSPNMYPQLSEVSIKLHLPLAPDDIFLSSEIQWWEQNITHQIESYLADKYLKIYIYI